MRKIHLYYLASRIANRSYLIHALQEFSVLLLRQPVGLNVEFEDLRGEKAKKVEEILRKRLPSPDYVAEISIEWPFEPPWPLLVCCRRDAIPAKAIRASNPMAQWGGTCAKRLAVVWQQDKYVIWHEILHLLGATDCYTQDDAGPTCELGNCIMQYQPCKHNVDQWPFICKANVRQIQNHLQRRRRL